MISSAPASRATAIDPTAQQRAASDPTASVWVNASAGSGKTTILTNRVTRLLLSGVRPERILCLTFTRAAAAEMALRVTRQLSFWAICSDNALSESLSDLQGYAPTDKQMTRARRLFAESLACAGGMRIRTLHAFAQEILRRFPIEADLPPHFAVIEEADARQLQEECLHELLRRAAQEPRSSLGQAAAWLIGRLGEKAFRALTADLLREKNRLQQALAMHGSIAALIRKARSALSLAPDDSEAGLIAAAFNETAFDESAIRNAARWLLQGTPSYLKRGEKILAWLELPIAGRLTAWRDYVGLFLTKDGDYLKNYGDKKLLTQHPDLDRILRQEATRLRILCERYEAVETATLTEAALQLGQALNIAYEERKRRQAALDYDDLVQQALQLLQRPGIAPWVLHKLDDGLDHLLVDEAQDTSRAQWNIVATLAEEFFSGATARDANRTLFVVGDEKQSIYSFQNADPAAFAAMRDFFKDKIRQADKIWREIPLHVSFRSAPAVLRAVDAVFADPAARQGVAAGSVEHQAFKPDLAGRVEIWPLIPQPEKEEEADAWTLPLGYENEHDPQAVLAERIAGTIKNWLAKGECLPNSARPIRPGDIMILLRRRRRFADLMVRALKQKPRDVAVTGVDRMRLMQQLPVMDLLALIQFVLLPEDNLNLASVLRGPLLNVSEDDLMRLAARRGATSLWEQLKRRVVEPPYLTAHDYLADLLRQADFTTPFAFLLHLLNRPCPGSAISGRRALWSRLGLDAMDPIDELLNAAQNFSRRHAPSLQSFVHWLSSSDSEIKRELDRGDDSGAGQVRIMTVHAAKGLEAPIVFLPDTTSMPRVQDVPKFLWNEQYVPFYLPAKPDGGPTRRLWDAARAAQLEEYRRLLYVALTRASQRLYIGGCELARREADGEGCWYNLVANGLKSSEAHARDTQEAAIVWEDPVLPRAAKPAATTGQKVSQALPGWALQPAAEEKAENRILSPSTFAGTPAAAAPDQAFARGRILHRLLQTLPDLEPDARETAAARFLAQTRHGLTKTQQSAALQELLRLLRHPDFAPLFGPGSRAEVPLAGFVKDQKFSGQVDRLLVRDDEVWVVDYKTNRPPPPDAADIPAAYRAQMETYRALLAAIYPGKQIRCFLLWTYGPHLMEIRT